MYDNGFSILEQYGMNAESVTKVRGGLVVQTPKETFILKEFYGNKEKLKKQQEILKHLQQEGFQVDYFIENLQGEIISLDKDENSHTLQKWYDGKECDTKNTEDILKSIELLAKMHKSMQFHQTEMGNRSELLLCEYERHNREIRRIQKFIRKKRPDNEFEKMLLKNAAHYEERGLTAYLLLTKSSYIEIYENAIKAGHICHGEYNHHNIIKTKTEMAINNFGHYRCNIQIKDLYDYMRKILEKHDWDCTLAKEMLEAYDRVKALSEKEIYLLKIMFLYPEKFWKLANYYFSHKKNWISEKNIQKLNKLISQEKNWENFLKEAFK